VDAGHSCTNPAQHDLSDTLDVQFIEAAARALRDGTPVRLAFDVRNVDRTVGTMLGSEVTRKFGPDGLPPNTIAISLTGTAGQSLGAFLPSGITLTLTGDANDYVAKGLSGGRVVVRPAENSPAQAPGARIQVIAGNTIGYGATSGELYLRGRVGERFAVRNSGALMVTEGAGDHALEYMTGGRVVILGPTGRNAAAGMSGGIAYLLDADRTRINTELVDVDVPAADELVWLGEVVADHARYTGSPIARALLAGWPTESARFSRVLPRDYRKVLDLQARAVESGVDADELIMEAARG